MAVLHRFTVHLSNQIEELISLKRVNIRFIFCDKVDLGYTIFVTAIATQGAEDSQDWVRTYHVTYSQDGRKWLSYFETGTSPEVMHPFVLK